jgi:hypothetical protein
MYCRIAIATSTDSKMIPVPDTITGAIEICLDEDFIASYAS